MPEPTYVCRICEKTFPSKVLESAERIGSRGLVIRLRVSGAIHVLKKVQPKKERL